MWKDGGVLHKCIYTGNELSATMNNVGTCFFRFGKACHPMTGGYPQLLMCWNKLISSIL